MGDSEQSVRGPADHLKPHWFKPGESGNPGGRPHSRLPTVLRDYLEGKSLAELREIAADENRPAVETFVARDLLDAMEDFESKRVNQSRARAWERLIGKVAQEMKLSGDLHAKLVRLDDEEQGQKAEDE